MGNKKIEHIQPREGEVLVGKLSDRVIELKDRPKDLLKMLLTSININELLTDRLAQCYIEGILSHFNHTDLLGSSVPDESDKELTQEQQHELIEKYFIRSDFSDIAKDKTKDTPFRKKIRLTGNPFPTIVVSEFDEDGEISGFGMNRGSFMIMDDVDNLYYFDFSDNTLRQEDEIRVEEYASKLGFRGNPFDLTPNRMLISDGTIQEYNYNNSRWESIMSKKADRIDPTIIHKAVLMLSQPEKPTGFLRRIFQRVF